MWKICINFNITQILINLFQKYYSLKKHKYFFQPSLETDQDT